MLNVVPGLRQDRRGGAGRPLRTWTRSPSPAHRRSAARSCAAPPATSSASRWSSAANPPTSSSRTPISMPPSRRPASGIFFNARPGVLGRIAHPGARRDLRRGRRAARRARQADPARRSARARRPPWVRWCRPSRCSACSTTSISASARARSSSTGGARVGGSAATSSSPRCSPTSSTHAHLAGRDLRAGRRGHSLQGRRGRPAASPTAPVQPGRRRVERGHRPRASLRQAAEGRHRVGEHLRPNRCAAALGRRARFRLRPRARRCGDRELHRPKVVWINTG